MNGGVQEWPLECTWRAFPHTQPCCTRLVKSGVKLSRPGFEDILDRGMVLGSHVDQLVDIKDGAAIRELNLWWRNGCVQTTCKCTSDCICNCRSQCENMN